MSKKIILSLLLTAIAVPAFAHGSSPSLLGALVSVGNHGSIANVGAAALNRNSLADVKLNVLNGAVKANADVLQSNRHADTLLGVSATVLDGGVGNRGGHW